MNKKLLTILAFATLGSLCYNTVSAKSLLCGLTQCAAVPSNVKNIFSGSESEMEELDKLEPITEDLQVAVDAHNVMNSLKNYKNIQKQYNNMKILHDKSVELLRNSEQCTLQYMRRYFNDPQKVWSGKDMSDHPENHDERQGLSAWAIDLFETAKAAEVSPVSTDDVVSVDVSESNVYDEDGNLISIDSDVSSTTETIGINVDADGNSFDLEEINKSGTEQANKLEEESGGNYFKEPSKQAELEKAARESELMSVDIGSNVAEWMAKYLANEEMGSGPEWNSNDLGGIKQPFPIWNDQKIFFNQYLVRKYANIHEYIKNYQIPEDINEKIAKTVFDNQKQYMNEAEKQLTQASVDAKLTAQKLHNEKVDKLKKDIEAQIDAYKNLKEKEKDDLRYAAQLKIEPLKSDKDALNKERDAISKEKDEIVQANNTLHQEISNLNFTLSSLNQQINVPTLSAEDKASLNAQIKEVNDEISKARKSMEEGEKRKVELNEEYTKKTEEYNELENKIKKIEDELQKDLGVINNQISDETQRVKEDEKKKIAEYEEELKTKNDNIDKAELAAKAAIGSKSMITAKQIISQTNLILEDAREKALENIEKLISAYKALGDKLYISSAQSVVDSYHQAYISALNGNDAMAGDVKLEAAAAKVHALSNFNIDIVISSIMDQSMKEMYLSDYRNMVKNTNVLLTVNVFDGLVKSIDSSIDDDYFVGFEPQIRDFMAPKAFPTLDLPPLREYVRLDYIDLQNIGKDGAKFYAGEYIEVPTLGGTGVPVVQKVWQQTSPMALTLIDKEKFLNYGGKIPEIWKLMLKDKAFVESDFYLSEKMKPDSGIVDQLAAILGSQINPLSMGGEKASVFRGGVYPCVLNNIKNSLKGVCSVPDKVYNGTAYIDVYERDIKNEEYRMVLDFANEEQGRKLAQMDLPTCQEVSVSCESGLVGTGKAYIYYPKEKENGPISISHKSAFNFEPYSELGTILNIYTGKMVSDGAMVENVLGLSVPMQSIANYGTRMEKRAEDKDSEELSKEENINDNVYVRAQYKTNQVGDFLDHFEVEQDYQKALDELSESIKESQEELKESFANFGLTMAEDFDISKQEDYEYAFDKLNSIKQSYASKAKKEIDDLNPGKSDMLKDHKNNFSKVHTALTLDDAAVMSLSMEISDLSEFREDLKTAKANESVDEAYEKTGDEDFEQNLKSLNPAYCATY